jgi:hypothetical protein
MTSIPINKDTASEIKKIFDDNTLTDLKRFIKKRQCLNATNSYLIYLFHFIQSAGILTSSIATSRNNINLIWVGISLNILAYLINVYEKTNNSILKKTMNDIKSIKDGNYVDECEILESEKKDNELNEPLISNQTSSYESFRDKI